MFNLAKKIINDKSGTNDVLLYWLGGASFIIKNNKKILGLDMYLSDTCRNERDDFKRLIPAPLKPEDIELDYLIATHDHGDHFDTGSLDKFISNKTKTKLIGPSSVLKVAEKLGIDTSKVIKLDRGEDIVGDGINIRGVFADHGKDSPDCIGVIIKIKGKNIYFTSDTCYRPDLPGLVNLKENIDLLLVPINGKFGNPDAKDASYITAWVKPEIVVPCHFWLFKEHGGDPGEFVSCCSSIAPNAKIKVLSIGEKLCF